MRILLTAAASVLLMSCASMSPKPVDNAELQKQVEATERAFAKTMADRDFAAFQTFLADETIFLGARPLRGKATVAEKWKHFYDPGSPAPFSWEPETVQVLDSGTLALSTGPVHDPQGHLIGTYSSIWRLEAPGTWRIIFDKGCDVCDCGKK